LKIISHRGNTEGASEYANSPDYVERTLQLGFDCEVDVWKVFNFFFLGHDYPKYKVSKSFLKNSKLWCHAKNLEALESMMDLGAHCFWHQDDYYTLTSQGYIWTYPNKITSKKSIIVHKDINWKSKNYDCFGVCTDYIA